MHPFERRFTFLLALALLLELTPLVASAYLLVTNGGGSAQDMDVFVAPGQGGLRIPRGLCSWSHPGPVPSRRLWRC